MSRQQERGVGVVGSPAGAFENEQKMLAVIPEDGSWILVDLAFERAALGRLGWSTLALLACGQVELKNDGRRSWCRRRSSNNNEKR